MLYIQQIQTSITLKEEFKLILLSQDQFLSNNFLETMIALIQIIIMIHYLLVKRKKVCKYLYFQKKSFKNKINNQSISKTLARLTI